MSDKDFELYLQHRIGQDKYVYFLLAAAAAGIALSVQMTADASANWRLVPLAMAVLSWAISFFAGCKWVNLLFHI